MLKDIIKEKNHWNSHSGIWNLVTSPLRPLEEDISIFKSQINGIGNRGLVLGVTPELTSIDKSITAFDKNISMIERVSSTNKVICGNWLDKENYISNKFDFLLGDGSLNMLKFSDEYKELFKILANNQKNITAIFRIFISPENLESAKNIVAEANKGKYKNFSAFKWRLAMSLTTEKEDFNIKVSFIHEVFNHYFKDREHLAKITGWDLRQINTIDNYANSDIEYSFPKLSAIRSVLQDYAKEISINYANYELSERCPIITYKI